MCGIVGVVGNITTNSENAFKLMLQLDVVRGRHSTGIIAVDRQGNLHSDKEPWLPQDFMDKESVKDIFRKNLRLLVGHNRHATVGAKNKAGAHPFEFDNVIGVHNGTTPKFPFKDSANYTVDSEALYNNLNHEGVDDTWLKVQGAASLAYYDKRLDNFHLVRNDQRPMNYAFSEDGLTMFFASEPWMIHVACSRCNVKIGYVMRTALDTLYTMPVAAIGKVVPQTAKLEAYVAPKQTTNPYASGYSPFSSPKVEPTDRRQNWWNYSRGDKLNVEVVDTVPQKNGSTKVKVRDFYNTKFVFQCYIGVGYEELVEELTEYLGLWEVEVLTSNQTTMSVNYKTFERLPLEDELDEDDGKSFFVEGHEAMLISRDMFNTKTVVPNDCCTCGDPLDFDKAGRDFSGFDLGESKPLFICKECQESIPDLEHYGDLLKITQVTSKAV